MKGIIGKGASCPDPGTGGRYRPYGSKAGKKGHGKVIGKGKDYHEQYGSTVHAQAVYERHLCSISRRLQRLVSHDQPGLPFHKIISVNWIARHLGESRDVVMDAVDEHMSKPDGSDRYVKFVDERGLVFVEVKRSSWFIP